MAIILAYFKFLFMMKLIDICELPHAKAVVLSCLVIVTHSLDIIIKPVINPLKFLANNYFKQVETHQRSRICLQ